MEDDEVAVAEIAPANVPEDAGPSAYDARLDALEARLDALEASRPEALPPEIGVLVESIREIQEEDVRPKSSSWLYRTVGKRE